MRPMKSHRLLRRRTSYPRFSIGFVVTWLLLLALGGCSSDPGENPDLGPPPATWTVAGPSTANTQCNPIAAEWDCLMPYPSNWFLAPDATLPSGFRVDVPEDAKPLRQDGKHFSFMDLHPADGFSLLPQIAVRIPGGVLAADLTPFLGDLAKSQQPTHRTLLIDAETGALVPHFAEPDPRPEAADDRVLFLRPVVRLQAGHRYVVALREKGGDGGLRHEDGTAVKAPAGYAALRAGQPPMGAVGWRVWRYFEAHVFPVLQKAGVARGDLLLAWDFTTETEAHAMGDLRAIRAQVLDAFAEAPFAVTATSVEEPPSGAVGRKVLGELTVPLFLTGKGEPGELLRRGPDGRPLRNGTVQVPFTVIIPRSVLDGSKPGQARLLQFGHGFFGTQLEVAEDFMTGFADQTGMVTVCVDWWGMSKNDVGLLATDLVNETAQAFRFTDRVHQGMANQIAVALAAEQTLAALPALQKGGIPVYDPAHVYFYGISQGHILGSVYAALSPRVDRVVLGVGGAGFSLIATRAAPFQSLLVLIDVATGKPEQSTRAMLTAQTVFDRIDPIAWAPELLAPTEAVGPKSRKVLMQDGISDTQVPNVASHVHARTLGLALLQPAPRPVFGLTPATAPYSGSALQEFDFGIAAPDLIGQPNTEINKVHEAVRRLQASIAQIDAFLRPDGKIVAPCDGVCDPE